MALSFVAAFLLAIQFVTAAIPGVTTPSPVMPGFPDNCNSFFLVKTGDICVNLPQEHQIGIDDFLRFNPYINGLSDCPSKLYADFYYCRETVAQAAPTTVPLHLPSTTDKSIYTPPPPPPPAATPPATAPPPPPPPPPTTAPPPDPTSCEAHNACYRAFAAVNPGVASSQSSWCTSLLEADITESLWGGYKGAPMMVTSVCPAVFPTLPAAEVLTSYCACLTAGQFGDQAHPTGHGAAQNKRGAREFWG